MIKLHDVVTRRTVWVTSAGRWGTLLWLFKESQKVKVRLDNGAHVVVTVDDVELFEVSA